MYFHNLLKKLPYSHASFFPIIHFQLIQKKKSNRKKYKKKSQKNKLTIRLCAILDVQSSMDDVRNSLACFVSFAGVGWISIFIIPLGLTLGRLLCCKFTSFLLLSFIVFWRLFREIVPFFTMFLG